MHHYCFDYGHDWKILKKWSHDEFIICTVRTHKALWECKRCGETRVEEMYKEFIEKEDS